MAKSYQTFIAEATQKAVAEFAPHQKAVGLLMPKIVAANKGEKVVFTAEEQATLKNAAAAAKQFENASGLFTPKNLAALTTQINNAKGIQVTANKYAQSDIEKIGEKVANGTLIQPRQGGTQSVIGWEKLEKNEAGKNTNYTQAKTILEKNPAFIEFMQDFANPDDPKSENFGATKAGKYAKVVIEFEVLSIEEMQKRGIGGNGIAITQVNIDGTWKDVRTCEFSLIKDVYKQMRIVVLLKNATTEGLPKGRQFVKADPSGNPQAINSDSAELKMMEAEQFAKPIQIISHEIFIHARPAAERLSKFQKTPTLKSFNELLAAINDATSNDQSGQMGGNVFGKEHQAISGIDANGNRIPCNAEYQRVNDGTFDVLQKEDKEVIRVKKQSPNPGDDENVAMYAFKDVSIQENTTVETVSKAEAFLYQTLAEKKDYVSIANKPLVNESIKEEFNRKMQKK